MLLPMLVLLLPWSIVGDAAQADDNRIDQFAAPAFDRPMVGPTGEVMPRIYVPLRPAQPHEIEDEFAPGGSDAFTAPHDHAGSATGAGGNAQTPTSVADDKDAGARARSAQAPGGTNCCAPVR